MSQTKDPVLEDYRRTLKMLHRLKRRYRAQGADQKKMVLVNEEIDEVSRTINHLQKKGDKRWKWD